MIAQDRAALAAILADEFIYHQPSGRVQDKPGYIEQVTAGEVRIKRAERYDIKINVYGNTATATGSTRVDVELKGEPKQFDLRFLDVWVKRDGRWQIVARQSAYKPAGLRHRCDAGRLDEGVLPRARETRIDHERRVEKGSGGRTRTGT
jgi:ketosteroid isomerase-like protein